MLSFLVPHNYHNRAFRHLVFSFLQRFTNIDLFILQLFNGMRRGIESLFLILALGPESGSASWSSSGERRMGGEPPAKLGDGGLVPSKRAIGTPGAEKTSAPALCIRERTSLCG